MFGKVAAVNTGIDHKAKDREERDRKERIQKEHTDLVKKKEAMRVYEQGRATVNNCPVCLRWYVLLADNLYEVTRKSPWFENFILGFILGSSITISLSTYDQLKENNVLVTLGDFILFVFVAEVAMKIVSEELRPWLYFVGPHRGWNIMDFCVVLLSVFDFGDSVQAPDAIRGLVAGVSHIAYIASLMLLIFYLYSILGILAFRKNDPIHWNTLPIAMTTLFRMSTLEDWTDVYYINYYGCAVYDNDGMYVLNQTRWNKTGTVELTGGRVACDNNDPHPTFSTFFFFTFIVISSLVLLSMFIGAISMSMSQSVNRINREMAEKTEIKSKAKEMKLLQRVVSMKGGGYQSKQGGSTIQEYNFKSPPVHELNRLRKMASRVRFVLTGELKEVVLLEEATRLRELYSQLSHKMFHLSRHPLFTGMIMAFICCSAVVEGVFTNPDMHTNKYMKMLEQHWQQIIASVFLTELVVKVIAEGFTPHWFFFAGGKINKPRGGNFFDTVIVVGSFLPGGGNMIIVLRSLRLLMIFKLASRFPKMRLAVDALMCGLASIGYVGLMMIGTFYFFAIFAVLLFQENDRWHFGNLHRGMITLFRLATLEDWTDVMYINQFGCDKYIGYEENNMACDKPQAFGYTAVVFFVVYITFGSLIMLNLFIGVIVTSMEEAMDIQDKEMTDAAKIKSLMSKSNTGSAELKTIQKTFEMIDLDSSGEISIAELKFALDNSKLYVKEAHLAVAFRVIIPDFAGKISCADFAMFAIKMKGIDGDISRIDEFMLDDFDHDTRDVLRLKDSLRKSKERCQNVTQQLEELKRRFNHDSEDRRYLIQQGMADLSTTYGVSLPAGEFGGHAAPSPSKYVGDALSGGAKPSLSLDTAALNTPGGTPVKTHTVSPVHATETLASVAEEVHLAKGFGLVEQSVKIQI